MASIVDKRREQWQKEHPSYIKHVAGIGWCVAIDTPSKEIVDSWVKEETDEGIEKAKRLGRYN